MQPNNPFANKQLRSLYDPTAEKWWFSAVDICAILTDSNYETGRKYWKKIKFDLSTKQNQVVTKSNQLKMPAQDGKYYFTEVLDTKEVIYLIQIIPSPKAEPFRLWLADMVANSTIAEKLLIEAGETCAKQIAEDYMKDPQKLAARHVITKRRLV